MRYLIGIDEAGRGPLAGPVSVGIVLVPADFDIRLFDGVRDSKQLTELQREEWYERLCAMGELGVRHSVVFSSAKVIDTRGVVYAVRSAIARGLRALDADPMACEIRLDGLLKAPAQFQNQRTIIRGDQTEPVISMASIAAKVKRDRLMARLAKRFPAYGFEHHKGYGTKLHRKALRKFGPSVIHRTSFVH